MSDIQLQKEQPPWVTFEDRFVEDRNASIAAGHLVQKSVHVAVVRPVGAKDSFEKDAEEWLIDQFRKADNGRIPREWADAWKKKFEAWKGGQDGPVIGFPVREWAGINRATAENLINVGVMSVETLAAANEQTLEAIGMGSRALQQKAKAFLAVREGEVNAEKHAAVVAELNDSKERIKALEAAIADLQAPKRKAG